MTSDDNNTWMLQNILQMKSWNNNNYSKLSLRKIYYNGQSITTLEEIMRGNSFVNEENIDKISSSMYMAFGCEYSDNLVKILKKTTETYVSLEKTNAIVLKIISVILDLIEIVPNVVSHEPGFLTTSLELNMRLNETIQLITNLSLDKNDIVKNDFICRKIWHMINSIERFITTKCPLDEDFVNEIFLEKSSVDEPKKFIDNMDNILENTGLNTTIILEFKTGDQQQKNENFIIVITEVINKLKPIMKIKNSIFENIENIENDFSDILSYMHFVFDSIMQIMYEQTSATLKSIEKCQSEKNADTLNTLVNKWSTIDLITTYKRLIRQSDLMQFPMFFIIHLKLNLRIIEDIIHYKKIYDIKFLKKQIKERSKVLKNKYRRELELIPRIKVRNEDLWEILSKIVSIHEFKFFNLIFKLHQNYGPVQNDSVELELNKMKYVTIEENIHAQQQCKIIRSLYVNCFSIKTTIIEFQNDPKKATELTQSFCTFLNATKNMGTLVPLDRSNENFKTIQRLLYRYLMGNNVNFKVDAIRLQKIVYFTMNLLDTYQIHSCQSLVHRSVIFAKYKKNRSETGQNSSTYGENATKCPEETDPNEHVEVKQMLAMLQNDYIELDFDSSNPTPLFYWKGELKNFKHISDDVKLHNAFDFSLFAKYINLTHSWIISVLFYTIIDVLEYFLKDSHVRRNNKLLTAYVRNLSTINFPTYFLPEINTMRKAENFYEPVDIIGYQILLKDHVKQYSAIQEKTNLFDTMSVYKVSLKNLYSRLMEKYDEIHMQSKINTAIESKTSKNTVPGDNSTGNNSNSTKSDIVKEKPKNWVKSMFGWGKK